MAMKNKWLCLFTVILMVVSISGFAIIADATGVPTITVSKVQGVVGQNVSVNLSIENNPGLAGATFQVVFDNSILTLESVTYNEADFGKDFEPVGNYLSPVNIAWSSMSNVTNNGVFLTLNFKIKEDTSAGNITTIGVLYSLGDFCDINEKDVLFEISDGVIMLIDSFPGDITGDGLVNSKDLIRLRKYFSGWDVEVDMTACDCNGDGNVNSKDLIRLRKHFSGWNVELLYGPINTVVECAHSLSHVAACDSKCDEDGNTEYWHCTKCGKYFSDADGKNEITLASTIIPSVGHTVVIDEAVPPTYDTTGLSEGSHCSVCEKIIKNQNVIPKLEAIYHSITYRNTKDAVIAVEKMKYAEHEGLIELPEPIVKGYVFKGWYTQSVGGELIDYIPENDTKNYVLFAHWEAVTYTVTYSNAPVNTNATSYTTEDRIVLEDPSWSGLMFVNWTDENGNVVSVIEKGSTGDIILTANWKSYRNNVVPAQNSKIMSVYNDKTGLYYFAYKLGTIENVVISSNGDSYNKTTAAGRTLTLEEKMTTSETEMSSIATTISHSSTSTESWSETMNWAKTHSKTENFTNTFTIGIKDLWKIAISDSAQFGITWGVSDSESRTTVDGKVDSETSSNSLNTSSTISYANTMSMSKSVEIEVPGVMPNGLYECVYTTCITVYGVVIYDSNAGDFCVGTYSTLGDLSATLMYYEKPSDKSDYPCEKIDFDIEKTIDIEGIINSFYYVQYDSNDGKGEKQLSAVKVNEESNLLSNEFTRDGFTFVGWSLTQDGEQIYSDGEKIVNLAEGGESVTLYAVWEPASYALILNTCGGTINSGNIPQYTYGQSVELPIDVTKPGYIFAGWYDDLNGKGKFYSKIPSDLFGDFRLYAHWLQIQNYTLTVENTNISLNNETKNQDINGTTSFTILVPDELKDIIGTGHLYVKITAKGNVSLRFRSNNCYATASVLAGFDNDKKTEIVEISAQGGGWFWINPNYGEKQEASASLSKDYQMLNNEMNVKMSYEYIVSFNEYKHLGGTHAVIFSCDLSTISYCFYIE